jgi:hypothetical protein
MVSNRNLEIRENYTPEAEDALQLIRRQVDLPVNWATDRFQLIAKFQAYRDS